MAIEVTVRDTETGQSSTATIENDYIVITAGTCEVTTFQDYPKSGTTQLTIKGRNGKPVKR